MAITTTTKDGVTEIVMRHPPVNALTVGDTWAIRDAFEAAGRDPSVRAVILTAEGKGFNAGIDIKEMQSVEGFDHLLGSSEACYATFKAIYVEFGTLRKFLEKFPEHFVMEVKGTNIVVRSCHDITR